MQVTPYEIAKSTFELYKDILLDAAKNNDLSVLEILSKEIGHYIAFRHFVAYANLNKVFFNNIEEIYTCDFLDTIASQFCNISIASPINIDEFCDGSQKGLIMNKHRRIINILKNMPSNYSNRYNLDDLEIVKCFKIDNYFVNSENNVSLSDILQESLDNNCDVDWEKYLNSLKDSGKINQQYIDKILYETINIDIEKSKSKDYEDEEYEDSELNNDDDEYASDDDRYIKNKAKLNNFVINMIKKNSFNDSIYSENHFIFNWSLFYKEIFLALTLILLILCLKMFRRKNIDTLAHF